MKPRAKDLNDDLMTKKPGRHEDQEGKKVKRSKQKEKDQKEIQRQLDGE